MSKRLLEASERMVLRGNILQICEIARPLGATEEVILCALRTEGYSCETEDVRRECAYLQGKGLLTLEEIGNDALRVQRTLASITPKGMDLLDGLIHEDGIQL